MNSILNFLRKHWFDIGVVFIPFLILYLILTWNANNIIKNILLLNLISLIIHQFEEYRFPGNFPVMMNKVMFNSNTPNRYPLNSNSALIINVLAGWLSYIAAIIFSDVYIIGIIVILASFGNVIAHVLLFNIKGETLYNPGMISSLILFLPVSVIFTYYAIILQLTELTDWIIGIIAGLILSFFSIFKVIDLLKNTGTKYIFK